MRRILAWATAVLVVSGGATPVAAQCMGCVSSSACGSSSLRGGCTAGCTRGICACADEPCQPGITAAPAGADYPARFAAGDGDDGERVDAVAVLVHHCDGSLELLVYSEDGTRLIESRLLLRESESVSPARLALAEAYGG
jgi:hypothetical protein